MREAGKRGRRQSGESFRSPESPGAQEPGAGPSGARGPRAPPDVRRRVRTRGRGKAGGTDLDCAPPRPGTVLAAGDAEGTRALPPAVQSWGRGAQQPALRDGKGRQPPGIGASGGAGSKSGSVFPAAGEAEAGGSGFTGSLSNGEALSNSGGECAAVAVYWRRQSRGVDNVNLAPFLHSGSPEPQQRPSVQMHLSRLSWEIDPVPPGPARYAEVPGGGLPAAIRSLRCVPGTVTVPRLQLVWRCCMRRQRPSDGAAWRSLLRGPPFPSSGGGRPRSGSHAFQGLKE
ncbi:uncharacterized protein LOC144364738 isoform X2 [Ictidomys tridecemlineatus]